MLLFVLPPTSVTADEVNEDLLIQFNVPEQRVDLALTQFAEQASITLLFPSDAVGDVMANRLVGEYSVSEGAEILLAGTKLIPTFKNMLVLNIVLDPDSNNGETVVKKPISILGRIGAVLAGALAGSNAIAEESGATGPQNDNESYIEEIVVTATYRETNLMDTPLAISALDEDMIEQLGATDISGVFRSIPGFNVASSDTGTNRFVVRGISSQTGAGSAAQTHASVATYIDDTPMTSATGPARQLAGSLFDIKRVEVLKGPQGTLFGEGSQGGTIRYIYNEADPSALDFKVKAGFNTQDESDDNGFRADGMINLPLSDNFAVRVSAFSEERAGWIDKTNISPIEEDINTLKSVGGRLSARWDISDALTAKASVFHTDTETEGAAIAQMPYVENQNGRIPGRPATSEDEFTLYNLRFDYELAGATFTSTTSYFERDTNAQAETLASLAGLLDRFVGLGVNLASLGAGGPIVIPCNPGPQDAFFSNFGACPYGDGLSLRALNNDSTSESERFIQEFRLVSDGEGPWLWTLGAFYKTSEDYREDFQPISMNPGREALQPVFAALFMDPSNRHTTELDEISVFGEVTYAFNEQWEATVGARFAKLEQEFENTATGTDDSPISPKAVLSFCPTDDQLYYFSYANGFRPGNVNNGQEFNVRQFTANGLPQQFIDRAASLITYESDEVDSFELGAKLTFADGRAQLATSAYYMDWSDTIMQFVDPTIPSVNNTFNRNAGAAHSQGVELEFTWMPVDSLNVRLAADFNEAETDNDNLANGVPEGNRLVYAPEWSTSLSVDYLFDIGSLQARLRADHQRVDDQFGDPENTLKIDGYDVTNLRFTLTDPADSRWSASLFANNVTGEDSRLSVVTLVGTVSNVYIQPRVVGLELTWQAR